MISVSLSAHGVHVRLGRREAVAGVDCLIQPGLLTVVIGPNGAGKTTLLRALAGLVEPYRGTIRVGEAPLNTVPPRERARTIAYLPQNGGVAWPIPVEAVVALGRMPYGEGVQALPPPGQQAVAAAIRDVGLEGFEARPATELSGGERARVLLARALATEAPILLADEPVAALDPRHQLLVLDVLKSGARRGAAIVAVMHDLALAARFADRIVLLKDGRLLAEGVPAEVLTPAQLAASFGIEASVTERDGTLVVIPSRALP